MSLLLAQAAKGLAGVYLQQQRACSRASAAAPQGLQASVRNYTASPCTRYVLSEWDRVWAQQAAQIV